MKRTITLAAGLIACLLIMGSVRPGGIQPTTTRPTEGGIRPIVPGGFTPVVVETLTVMFEPSWGTGSSSPYYPGAVDQIIKDDGSGDVFKYGHVRRDTPDVVSYAAATNRSYFGTRFRMAYPAPSQRIAFYRWAFDRLPGGAKILSAHMYAVLGVGAGMVYDENKCVWAALDLSPNYANIVSGPNQSGNNSYHSQSYNFPDATEAITPWSAPLDTLLYNPAKIGSDLNWVVHDINEQEDSGWLDYNLTKLVQRWVDLRLPNETLMWALHEGHNGYTYNFGMGPSHSVAGQPFAVVQYVTRNIPDDPVEFFVFSDNHSNPGSGVRIQNTLDRDGITPLFAVHNGDMNYLDDCDSVFTKQSIEDVYGAGFPIAWADGNHETSANNTCIDGNSLIDKFIPTENRAFISGMSAWGGDAQSYGAYSSGYDSFVETNRNRESKFSSFSFDVGAAHIVILACEPQAATGSAVYFNDIEWLKADLYSSSKRAKLVFFHKPYHIFEDMDYGGGAVEEGVNGVMAFPALHQTMKDGGVTAVFGGHTHRQWIEEVDGMYFVNTRSMKTDAAQGFIGAQVSGAGSVSLNFYSGVQSDTDFVMTHQETLTPVPPAGQGINPPSAGFWAGTRTIDVPQTVEFKSYAIPGTIEEYRWNFGDGTPTIIGADLETISHEYTVGGSPGTWYDVTLTTTGPGGIRVNDRTQMIFARDPALLSDVASYSFSPPTASPYYLPITAPGGPWSIKVQWRDGITGVWNTVAPMFPSSSDPEFSALNPFGFWINSMVGVSSWEASVAPTIDPHLSFRAFLKDSVGAVSDPYYILDVPSTEGW